MARVRSIFILLCLMTTALPNGRAERPVPALSNGVETPSLCDFDSLPPAIRSRLKTDFSSWKIQEPKDLSEYTRKTWVGRKPSMCPGIAVGLFQSAKTASYAFLLVRREHPDAGYRFTVFTPNTGQPTYGVVPVEQSDSPGASNYFIRKVPASQFFSSESKKKFHLEAGDCILMVDSAEQEYGTDIYFWANGRYQHEPVDD